MKSPCAFVLMLITLSTAHAESQLVRAEDWIEPESSFLALDSYVRPDRAPLLSVVASLSMAPIADLLAVEMVGATEAVEARADFVMGFDEGVEVAFANVRVGPRFRIGAVGALATFTHSVRGPADSLGAGGYGRIGELAGLHLEVGIAYQRRLSQSSAGVAFLVNGLVPLLRHKHFSLDVIGKLRIAIPEPELAFGSIELRAMFRHLVLGILGQFNGDGPQIGHLGISLGVYR